MRKFKKEPLDITIDYQANTDFVPDVVANRMAEFVHTGVSGSNYIIYNQAFYWSEQGSPIKRGTQKFHIFARY